MTNEFTRAPASLPTSESFGARTRSSEVGRHIHFSLTHQAKDGRLFPFVILQYVQSWHILLWRIESTSQTSGGKISPRMQRAIEHCVSIVHWQFPLILQTLRFPPEFSATGLALAILSLNRPISSPSIYSVLVHLISGSTNILCAPNALTFN